MSYAFISYVKENEKQVEKLCQDLKSRDIDVWLDRNNILPGMRWKDAIRQAIKDGAFFIACFSREYEQKNKTYMNEELLFAVDELRQYSINRTWFIPVLFSKCNAPTFGIGGGQTLLDFQWVDLSGDWNLGFQKLLKVLKVDEIAHRKEMVDECAHKYESHYYDGPEPILGYDDVHSPESYKRKYLKEVRELKDRYGISYDPLKLDRS